MEQPNSDSPDHGAAARALLGDELAAPPSAAKPLPVATVKARPENPPAPLPELALEFGPDIPDIQWGAAWCLVTGLVWALLALAGVLQPGWLENELAQYVTGVILLFTALGQINGLSYLQRIDPIHRAREYLALSWFLIVVMTTLSAIGFLLFKLQIDGGLIFATFLISWFTSVGSFWSILFGLRRIGIYVGELRIITQSYLCQILLGFLFGASIIKLGLTIGTRQMRGFLNLLPDALVHSIATISPTILGTAAVTMLLYVHCLWLLWRACGRAQRQAAIKSR